MVMIGFSVLDAEGSAGVDHTARREPTASLSKQPDQPKHDGRAQERHDDGAQAAQLVGKEDEHDRLLNAPRSMRRCLLNSQEAVGDYDTRLATCRCFPMRVVIVLALAVFSLYGCAVYTPAGSVVVDPADRPSGGGSFCPPGQAKKGRC
jgi:hypothetical protein